MVHLAQVLCTDRQPGFSMYYYVMQELGNNIVAYGPYKSESSRDNRYDNVSGGELSKFNTFEADKDRAVQEFRDEGARTL